MATLLACGVALLAAGCSLVVDGEGVPGGKHCRTAADCLEGNACVAGACRPRTVAEMDDTGVAADFDAELGDAASDSREPGPPDTALGDGGDLASCSERRPGDTGPDAPVPEVCECVGCGVDPAIVFETHTGSLLRLDTLRGRVVWLQVGSEDTDGTPSVAGLAATWYRTYQSKGVEIIQVLRVNGEGEAPTVADLAEWRTQHGGSYVVARDRDGSLARLHPSPAEASTILIDKRQLIRLQGRPARAALVLALDSLLDEE